MPPSSVTVVTNPDTERPAPEPLLAIEQLHGRFKARLTAMLLAERARDRELENGRSRPFRR
jgi:hypothetical protein